MGWEGKQGHVVVVGSIGGARITPYQLGTWRHLEEDGSHGIPWDDQVRVRLRVGLVGLVDWLRPYRIGVPRHFRAGRFLKLVLPTVLNIQMAVFQYTNRVYFEWEEVIRRQSWHVFHFNRNSSCVITVVSLFISISRDKIVPPG